MIISGLNYKSFFHTFLLIYLFFLLFPNISTAAPISQCEENTTFNIGAGIYDITGPAAEERMMGYGMIFQKTAGIYQRLWARAFVIESPCNGKRVVFVNADLGQIFQGIKEHVVMKLQEKYGDLYDDSNVLITATHQHSGPGGYSTYVFYNLSILGFSRENFDTIVDGIVTAIERAQHNMTKAQIKIAKGQLTGITNSRDPIAYLENPQSERDRYSADIDTDMTLIRFDSLDGKPIGTINWFPIHGVSMNNKNFLINGDNKGYAEYLFEKDFNSDHGPTAFVAAFAQANAGDVTPNPYGEEGGRGLEGISDVEKAGRPQYEKAKQLFDNATEIVKGGIDYRHRFVAMDTVTVDPKYTDGKIQMTCPAAIGISMLAGTQDGEGVGRQGIVCDEASSDHHQICKWVTTPCQGVKPIVIQTGIRKPYPWTPNILPFQIIKIGNLVITAASFELTTMTGRRIRETVTNEFPKSENNHFVLSTLANAYAGYVATNEEYQLQRYEAASTHFGPWTSAALQQEFAKLAKAIVNNESVDAGPTPPDLLNYKPDVQPGVIVDEKPVKKQFGDVYQNVQATYTSGETVKVVFWGGHPKNNYHTQDTFLAVQRLENGKWNTIRKDWDWDTEYHWKRSGISYSLITIVWRTSKDTPKGQYRIVHYGDWKSLQGKITPYAGYSSVFTLN